MGNQNKKQGRSFSNPGEDRQDKKLELQSQNDVQIIKNLTPKMIPSPEQDSTQQKVIINPPKTLQKHENETYHSLRQKRSSSVKNQTKKEFQLQGIIRNTDQDQRTNKMQSQGGILVTGGGGKKRKSLEDLMINEIKKLKRYSPTKSNLHDNSINNKQQQHQQQQTQINLNNNKDKSMQNQTFSISNNNNKNQFNSKSISPQSKQQNRQSSPDDSILKKSGLFIPSYYQNIKLNNQDESNNIGNNRIEELSILKQQQNQRNKRNNNNNSTLFRSQTNPRKRQNWDMIIKQTPQTNKKEMMSVTQNIISSQNSNNIKQNKQIPQIQNPQNNLASSLIQMNLSQTNYSQNFPQISSSQPLSTTQYKKQQIDKFPPQPPQKIEELFQIYEGGKKKISQSNERYMNNEKQSYLIQMNEILAKKYQNNNKLQQSEFDKIEPYVRPQQGYYQSKKNKQIITSSTMDYRKSNPVPMYIINSPHQDDNDFINYCKLSTTNTKLRSSSQENNNIYSNNTIKNQNIILRSQLNPIYQRNININNNKDPLKNLSKLRSQKPFQISFDNQQYNILQNDNVKNNIENNSNGLDQTKNTFYNYNSQIKDQDQSHYNSNQGETQNSFLCVQNYLKQSSNQNQNHNNNEQEEQNNVKKEQNESDNQIDQPQQQKILSPENKSFYRDRYDESCMITTTQYRFDNQNSNLLDSQYGFSDINNNHLNQGLDKMKIRKYQNNSQIGLVSQQDILKIYMKNPLLDVYTSTLKQSQQFQFSKSNNLNKTQYNQISTIAQLQQGGNKLNQSLLLQDQRNHHKQQLISSYSPIKSNQNKKQIQH